MLKAAYPIQRSPLVNKQLMSDLTKEVQAISNPKPNSQDFAVSHNPAGWTWDQVRKVKREPWAFDYQALPNNVVRISPGTIRIAGISKIEIADDTELTLTAATEWIYVEVVRTSNTASVKNSASEPESTLVYWRIPLQLWTKKGESFTLTRVLHKGEIKEDTPIAG